jgi:hypothetical protein
MTAINALLIDFHQDMDGTSRDLTTAVELSPDMTVGEIVDRYLMGRSLVGDDPYPKQWARLEIRAASGPDESLI